MIKFIHETKHHMKKEHNLPNALLICIMILLVSVNQTTYAQTDSTAVDQTETQITQSDTITQNPEKKKNENKFQKQKDEFIPYVGLNFNKLSVASTDFQSDLALGYHFGFNYKRGKFFYWQIGARFNHSYYHLTDLQESDTTSFSVNCIDVPITVGINVLSAVNRLVALRIFVSAAPSFALNVGDNDFGFSKDDINTFILYGQAGLGVNVAFVVIEAGFNYGFQDLLKEHQSKPGQIFVNLGFRF